MKKILLMILILTTFLFITSCDKKETENNDNTSSETSSIEETTTEEESSTVIPNEPIEYYEKIFHNDIGYLDVYEIQGESILDHTPKVITSYKEFEAYIEFAPELKDYCDEKIFEDNYLLAIDITFTTGGYSVLGYYDFVCDAENKLISVSAKINYSGGIVSECSQTFLSILAIPKEMFPTNAEEIPSEIIIRNWYRK